MVCRELAAALHGKTAIISNWRRRGDTPAELMVQVDCQSGEQVCQVFLTHVVWEDARNGSHTGLQQVQFGFHRTVGIAHSPFTSDSTLYSPYLRISSTLFPVCGLVEVSWRPTWWSRDLRIPSRALRTLQRESHIIVAISTEQLHTQDRTG